MSPRLRPKIVPRSKAEIVAYCTQQFIVIDAAHGIQNRFNLSNELFAYLCHPNCITLLLDDPRFAAATWDKITEHLNTARLKSRCPKQYTTLQVIEAELKTKYAAAIAKKQVTS